MLKDICYVLMESERESLRASLAIVHTMPRLETCRVISFWTGETYWFVIADSKSSIECQLCGLSFNHMVITEKAFLSISDHDKGLLLEQCCICARNGSCSVELESL